MAAAAPSPRPIVIKAQRETVILVAAATLVTFALASTIHSRPPVSAGLAKAVEQRAWTGDLAALKPTGALPGEPLTSASLVVAKSDLALPSMNVRTLVKLKGCEGSVCAAKAVVPTPARRPGVETAEAPTRRPAVTHRDKPSLISRFNPLTHLPDLSTLGKPFASAGDTVSGWLRRF